MKKIFIITFIITIVFPIYSQTIKKLAPLSKSETLDYSYNLDKDILTIYKINESKKQIYFENTEALWGGYQISKDKKTMIFWKNTFERSMPLYYLDGNTGDVKFLGKVPFGARMDATGIYLMNEDVYNSGVFTIFNLNTGKIVSEITWNVKNKEKWTSTGAVFDILRAAENGEYDFMILFSIERLCISKAFVKITSLKVFTEFDDSNLSEIQLRQSANYGNNFTGWY